MLFYMPGKKYVVLSFMTSTFCSQARSSCRYRLWARHILATLLEPSFLFLWFFRWWGDIFSKELIRWIVVSNIPEVLCHGNNKAADDKHSQQCSIFSFWRIKTSIELDLFDIQTISLGKRKTSKSCYYIRTFFVLGFLSRLESRACVVELLRLFVYFIFTVHAFSDDFFGNHHATRW